MNMLPWIVNAFLDEDFFEGCHIPFFNDFVVKIKELKGVIFEIFYHLPYEPIFSKHSFIYSIHILYLLWVDWLIVYFEHIATDTQQSCL